MNEQEEILGNTDQALKEILVIAQRYGLSYSIVLTDEKAAACQFDIAEDCVNKKLVTQNLYKATNLMLGSLAHQLGQESPKGFGNGNKHGKRR